jgi:hypothetical protein
MKFKFYIEYWGIGSTTKEVIADTFHIKKCHLVGFLRRFVQSGKNIVHLELLEEKRTVLHSTRLVQHKA